MLVWFNRCAGGADDSSDADGRKDSAVWRERYELQPKNNSSSAPSNDGSRLHASFKTTSRPTADKLVETARVIQDHVPTNSRPTGPPRTRREQHRTNGSRLHASFRTASRPTADQRVETARVLQDHVRTGCYRCLIAPLTTSHRALTSVTDKLQQVMNLPREWSVARGSSDAATTRRSSLA